jgi:hypothetical protein
MIQTMKTWVILPLMLALAGCASEAPPPPLSWTGGDPAHLAADKAACAHESAGVDINEATGYSDPRYGTTSAMAAAINRDAPLSDQHAAVRAAAFAACMTDKGWKAE